MKKISKLILLTFLINYFLPPLVVLADMNFLRNSINASTIEIGQFEVVIVKTVNTTTTESCASPVNKEYIKEDAVERIGVYNSYAEAKAKMDSLPATINSVPTIFGYRDPSSARSETAPVKSIIDTKYGLLDLNVKGTSLENTYIYDTVHGTSYVNGYYPYGPDAVFLEYNPNNKMAKTKISGVTGWINRLEKSPRISDIFLAYKIVPIASVRSFNYYYVENGNLYHSLPSDIGNYNCVKANLNLGPAPTYLSNGIKYYSYDGNYFYNDILKMIDDYKINVFTNAVNSNLPYYNYYQYVPFRTSSVYNANDINQYIINKKYTAETSKLYNSGTAFANSQFKYGINFLTTFGVAVNESGWGTSGYALNRNNLFGHAAGDSNPDNASYYSSVDQSINVHALGYISYGYGDIIRNTVYRGAFLGNKASGANVKYASDPYWGEKAASHYANFDQAYGFADFNRYEIGIKKAGQVTARKSPSSTSDVVYTYPSYGNISIAIVGEVVDLNNGKDIWYKIISDSNLDSNKNYITRDAADTAGNYNLENNYIYVPASAFFKVDTPIDPSIPINYTKKANTFHLENLSYDSANSKLSVSGALVMNEVNYASVKAPSYALLLTNQNDNSKVYTYPINKWDSGLNYYQGAWFKNDLLDLNDLPVGDYNISIRSRFGTYESTATLVNTFGKEIVKKYVSNNKTYLFRADYSNRTLPIQLFVRDNGVITNDQLPTYDNMFADVTSISFNSSNQIAIKGTSYNVGGTYSTVTNVERKIILENVITHEKVEYNAGYIDNGDYPIYLRVPDGKDKTRAWYQTTFDVSSLAKGKYIIRVYTKVPEFADSGEIVDIFQRTFEENKVIGEKKYSIKVNKEMRNRLELWVE